MTWLVKKTKRTGSKTNKQETKKNKENKATFILNITKDHNLQRKFLVFEKNNRDSCYQYNNLNNEKKDEIGYYQFKCTILNIL